MSDDGVFKQPKGTMPKIEYIWAFLAVDPADENEGVMSYQTSLGHMPMIASDRVRLDEMTPMAEGFAKALGIEIKLVKFTQREEVRVINPKGG